jgi:hypothetical protein
LISDGDQDAEFGLIDHDVAFFYKHLQFPFAIGSSEKPDRSGGFFSTTFPEKQVPGNRSGRNHMVTSSSRNYFWFD